MRKQAWLNEDSQRIKRLIIDTRKLLLIQPLSQTDYKTCVVIHRIIKINCHSKPAWYGKQKEFILQIVSLTRKYSWFVNASSNFLASSVPPWDLIESACTRTDNFKISDLSEEFTHDFSSLNSEYSLILMQKLSAITRYWSPCMIQSFHDTSLEVKNEDNEINKKLVDMARKACWYGRSSATFSRQC